MDRATDRMFIHAALAGRCDARSSCETFRTRGMCAARAERTGPGRRAVGLIIAVVVVA